MNSETKSPREKLFLLYDQIRPRLLDLGIRLSTVAYKRKKIEEASDAKVQHCVNWLEALIEVKIKQLDEAIALIPDYMWNNYKAMCVEDLGIKEIEIRKAAEKELILHWKNRPELLKRTDGPKSDTRTGGKGKKSRRKDRQAN